MKKILALILLGLVVTYVVKQMVYQPYMWKKAIASPEHRLQLGSFIFTNSMEHNGSQSRERRYTIFKVVEIDGDHVRLSVVRQLSSPTGPLSGFSTNASEYASLKKTINHLTITRIAMLDLYGDKGSHQMNDQLLAKYPALKTSRYYFEDDTELRKEAAERMEMVADREASLGLVYSEEQIISNARLVPWVFNNSTTPELAPALAKKIDLIVN